MTLWQSVTQAALLTLGFSTALGLVALVLREQGILREAYFWTITDHSIPHVFWTKAMLHTLAFVGLCLPLLIGAVMASRKKYRGLWNGRDAERMALLGLVAASAVGAAAGARFVGCYIRVDPAARVFLPRPFTACPLRPAATQARSLAAASGRDLRLARANCGRVFRLTSGRADPATRDFGDRKSYLLEHSSA